MSLADSGETGVRRGDRTRLHLLSSVWLRDHLSLVERNSLPGGQVVPSVVAERRHSNLYVVVQVQGAPLARTPLMIISEMRPRDLSSSSVEQSSRG